MIIVIYKGFVISFVHKLPKEAAKNNPEISRVLVPTIGDISINPCKLTAPMMNIPESLYFSCFNIENPHAVIYTADKIAVVIHRFCEY